MNKPFSQACENNKRPLLQVLETHLEAPGALLEIGSGTGQHAAWLGAALRHVQWQPSDLPDALPGIGAWLEESGTANVLAPTVLDVRGRWPEGPFDYVFTANTFHIMSTRAVAACIAGAAERLRPGGLFLVYGPFRYGGDFTSESNRAFDQWLREHHPDQGIRDFEWVSDLMARQGLSLLRDHEMPANNRTLVFRRH